MTWTFGWPLARAYLRALDTDDEEDWRYAFRLDANRWDMPRHMRVIPALDANLRWFATEDT